MAKLLVEEKTCNRCRKSKSLDRFHNNNNKYVDGKVSYCKECVSEYARNWYAKSIGKSKDQIGKRNITEYSGKIINGQKLCSLCRKWKPVDCYDKNINIKCGLRSHCDKCNKYYYRITNELLKMEFILAYGGKCSCCGEKEVDLLTIEHIRNKGHKLLYDTGFSLFYKLKKLEWPTGYDCLCWNCNMSTRNGKPCIHSKERKVYEQEFETFLLNDNRQVRYNELRYKLQIKKVERQ